MRRGSRWMRRGYPNFARASTRMRGRSCARRTSCGGTGDEAARGWGGDYAAAKLCAEDFLRRVEIDAVLELPEINERAIEELFGLAPFGHSNPAPMFASLNVEVAAQQVWKEKHLKLTVRQNGRTLSLKAW